MKYFLLTLITAIVITTTGCTNMNTTSKEGANSNIKTTQEIQIDMTDKDQVIDYTIKSLKTLNIDNLAKVISKDGLSFSPYIQIDTIRQITIKKDEIKEAFNSGIEYVRGVEDGSGLPIILTFKKYIKKYVYDVDFLQLAEKNYGEIPQRGNDLNNINIIYPGASTVEFFVPEINPEYAGLDRRSLIFVMKQEKSERKIRAIIHNERTI